MIPTVIRSLALPDNGWRPAAKTVGFSPVRKVCPTAPAYLKMHAVIGGKNRWWMMAAMPKPALRAHLSRPDVRVFISPEVYFELNGSHLAYFGVFPAHRNQGIGRCALDQAIIKGARTLTTSSHDSPWALRMYLDAGFVETSIHTEDWPE